MKVSLNAVKQYIDFELPPVDELVKRINEQLGGVEEVIDLGARYKGAVIVHVTECDKLENSDHLHKCLVDDGGVTSDVERNEQGLVQVLTGAPNVHKDMLAVWLPPKSVVPETFDTDPFTLESRNMRGAMSHGMLASARELAIGDAHEGIIDLTHEQSAEGGAPLQPGSTFADAFGLNGTIIDIENKMFTHRPDGFGQLGVAREIAGILGYKFTSPDWYVQQPSFANAAGLDLEVFNDATELVPRFMALAIDGIEVKESPLWLQCALVTMGARPINNIVDATNYVMLTTAQPTHAYDYDKLRGHKLGARMAHSGESITLLNDKTYELQDTDIVIADGEGPVGLAGIMGGGESEVDASTTRIVLEVATFDMYAVRKSSMRHGVFTDALARFNKGQSPRQNARILQYLARLVQQVSPASKQASNVADAPQVEWADQAAVQVTSEFVNERLGSDFTTDQMKTLLENVEVTVDGNMSVKPPFWRTDIELPEDVVEEVGRLHGFDSLPRELPTRSSAAAPYNLGRVTKQRVRESLARAGANEVLTYSFVHEQVLARAEQDITKAFRLGNALSPDLQYYRLSLTPSLLDKLHGNVKAGFDEFMIFEIGKAHHKDEQDDEGLPQEFGRITAVYTSKKSTDGAAYYKAKRMLEQALKDATHSCDVSYQKLSDFDFGTHDAFRQLAAPFDAARSATVWVGERLVGVVGEYKRTVQRAFKLSEYTAGFEVFTSTFEKLSTNGREYTPLSRFPSTRQDISLKSGVDVRYGALLANVRASLNEQANG
ncbi:MAG TPA: phenylalanine--tRNA ligase subunit beta, partial [Patescibacteria group bacterium]|nr:phenylalanine--tRNA ligase subunit beta [Patescibacteria group bacterium]